MADEDNDVDDLEAGGTAKGNGKDSDEIHIEVLDHDDGDTIENGDSLPSDEIQQVERQLIELRKEKEDIYDRLLRKHADFENFRKRADKDKREFQMYAHSEFMYDLLPILDNFERALAHSDEQSGPEYRKGVELIYRQLRDVLEKRGLKAIQSKGQTFDPNLHEAIAREEHSELEENTILEELQKGYYFRERLLRPALVKVSSRPAGGRENDQPQEDTETSPDESDEEWQKNESSE